jgi:hypothetical protein
MSNTNSNTNSNKANDWKQREVGALWKRSGPKGSYCTGYVVSDELGSKVKQRVIMFANKTKLNEKSPDFVIYISNDPEPAAADKSASNSAATVSNDSGSKRKSQPEVNHVSQTDDDDVPM